MADAVLAVVETAPVAVTESLPTPVIEGERNLRTSLRADEPLGLNLTPAIGTLWRTTSQFRAPTSNNRSWDGLSSVTGL
jgi:hypothetical protein